MKDWAPDRYSLCRPRGNSLRYWPSANMAAARTSACRARAEAKAAAEPLCAALMNAAPAFITVPAPGQFAARDGGADIPMKDSSITAAAMMRNVEIMEIGLPMCPAPECVPGSCRAN